MFLGGGINFGVKKKDKREKCILIYLVKIPSSVKCLQKKNEE